jgi:hypothetical protein
MLRILGLRYTISPSMPARAAKDPATVGVFDHWGWAVLVTAARDGRLIDRRRVDLVDGDLPKFPHHVEGQALPVREAVALVARVARAAEACAKAGLGALAAAVSTPIAGLALRVCPPLPATVEERLSDYRAQNVADSVMYREALARAAEARGWTVFWYDARRVRAEAAGALGRKTIEDLLEKTGAALGPPWTKDHKLAMAAAIAAGARANSVRRDGGRRG